MSAVYPSKHLITLDEWRIMGECNVFPPDINRRLELINGEMFEVPSPSPNHAEHVMRLNSLIIPIIPDDLISSVHGPLQLGNFSEPLPDFMLLKPHADSYSSRHPNADDVLLLIEVADSSLKFDQTEKLRLYALHGIPEYWLLNLNNASLEVYRKPNGETYAEKTTLSAGHSFTLSQLPELSIQVADIL